MHWKEYEYFVPSWRERVEAMAIFIDAGEVVVDLGCGQQHLRNLIPPDCEYIPVDYTSRTTDTLVCDFNCYKFPAVFVDVAFVSGVLEYVLDVDWFIERCTNQSETKVVISYCCWDGSAVSLRARNQNHWVNRLTEDEVIGKFEAHGYALADRVGMGATTIWNFQRKHARQPYGVLIYPTQLQNLGDYTQAAAVTSITGRPEDAVFLSREDLHRYRGKPLPVICNGWFAHDVVFPPADRLVPLYISLHIATHARQWFATSAMLEHLRRYAPIGCRDRATMDFLIEQGVPAYFSHCVTLGLGLHIAQSPASISPATNRVYLIDPPVVRPKKKLSLLGLLYKGLTQPRLLRPGWLFAQAQQNPVRRFAYSLLFAGMYGPLIKRLGMDRVVCESQFVPLGQGNSACGELLGRVMTRIQSYRQVRAVITGRIHVAIPARAAGARVVFARPLGLSSQEHNRIQDHQSLFAATVDVFPGRAPVDAILNAVERCGRQGMDDQDVAELVTMQTQRIHAFLASFDSPATPDSL